MSKQLKVLQLHPDYNVKSIDVSDLAEQIIKGLPEDSYEVTSAYLSGIPKPEQPKSIAQHQHYFNLSESNMKGLRLLALWKLYQFCKKNAFDVVICNRFKTVSLMLQVNKFMKIPLCIGISHVLNEYNRTYRRLQVKLFADNSWQFVGVSKAVKDYLISYNAGFNNENTHTIPNAIDIHKSESFQLNQQSARSQLGLPKNARIIGTIGQLFPRKGHRFLISALANTQQQFPDAHIAIIGRGSEEQNLIKQINESGLQDRVHLLGFKENALQFVRAFDIWAMPSLKEGLPLALMEGMSGHLPVIAADIPEMHDIIKEAGGILVKPRDIEGLTKAFTKYLSLDQKALTNKGEQAFQYLVKHHSIEDYRKSYLQLIEMKLIKK